MKHTMLSSYLPTTSILDNAFTEAPIAPDFFDLDGRRSFQQRISQIVQWQHTARGVGMVKDVVLVSKFGIWPLAENVHIIFQNSCTIHKGVVSASRNGRCNTNDGFFVVVVAFGCYFIIGSRFFLNLYSGLVWNVFYTLINRKEA